MRSPGQQLAHVVVAGLRKIFVILADSLKERRCAQADGFIGLLRNLVASVNYTYTDTKNFQTRRWLPREPQHRWNVGLTWEPMRGLSLFTQVHVVTQQWETFGEVYNSGYTRVDLGGTYRVLEKYNWVQGVDLILRVQNLLNEGYAEVRGFPALGTNVLIGLRVGF